MIVGQDYLRPYYGGYRVAVSWSGDEVYFAAPRWDHEEWNRRRLEWEARNPGVPAVITFTHPNPDRHEREAGRLIVVLKMVAEHFAKRADYWCRMYDAGMRND